MTSFEKRINEKRGFLMPCLCLLAKVFGSMMNMVSKNERWHMFNAISATYDSVNRWITFGADSHWRSQLVARIPNSARYLVDVAAGTMDVAIAAAKQCPQLIRITALDMAQHMLAIGDEKCKKTGVQNVESLVADVHRLPMAKNSVDAITVAFGIRNFEHLDVAFLDMHRVLAPGAPLLILESCQPKQGVLRQLNRWYLRWWVQPIGGWLSGKADAYAYLSDSIDEFHSPETLRGMLINAGFSSVTTTYFMAQSVQLIHAVK